MSTNCLVWLFSVDWLEMVEKKRDAGTENKYGAAHYADGIVETSGISELNSQSKTREDNSVNDRSTEHAIGVTFVAIKYLVLLEDSKLGL